MPIIYHEATDSWEATDLSVKERESLVRSATQLIINSFSEEIANRIIGQAGIVSLEDTPKEQMGNA